MFRLSDLLFRADEVTTITYKTTVGWSVKMRSQLNCSSLPARLPF